MIPYNTKCSPMVMDSGTMVRWGRWISLLFYVTWMGDRIGVASDLLPERNNRHIKVIDVDYVP